MSSIIKPARHLAELPTLKLRELTRLARLTGVSISGTKGVVSERVLSSLQEPKLVFAAGNTRQDGSNVRSRDGRPHAHRILSIDMGIRNLAYCRLLVEKPQPTDGALQARDTSPLGRLIVETWQRFPLGLSRAAIESKPTHEAASLGRQRDEQQGELFTPPVLAKHALSLLRSLVLESAEGPPDTILIERQRWRSGGHASIQEWTLRVNSVEAMLWAGLEILRDQGLWIGRVHAVDPGAVSRFWLHAKDQAGVQGDDTGPARKTKQQKEEKGKAAKMNVARRWISSGAFVEPGDQTDVEVKLKRGIEKPSSTLDWGEAAVQMRDYFSSTGRSKQILDPRNAEMADASPLKFKKDDLADCLLQGVAWVKWEENRRAIVADRAVLSGEDSPLVTLGRKKLPTSDVGGKPRKLGIASKKMKEKKEQDEDPDLAPSESEPPTADVRSKDRKISRLIKKPKAKRQ